MSVMDLLKSPKGIDLLQELLDASKAHSDCTRYGPGGDPQKIEEYGTQLASVLDDCIMEIGNQQAIDKFKTIDGTPAKLTHKWNP